jgi:hypothetical protein
MHTQEQIDASKLNRVKSTGPISKGAINLSQNARKHALAGHKLMLVEGESSQEWHGKVDDHMREFKPESALRRQVGVGLAAAVWRLRCSKFVEAAIIDLEIDKQRRQLEETYTSADQSLRHASAMMGLGVNISLLDQYHALVAHNFDSLRSRRKVNFAKRTQEPTAFCRTALENESILQAPQRPDHHSCGARISSHVGALTRLSCPAPADKAPGERVLYNEETFPSVGDYSGSSVGPLSTGEFKQICVVD